MNPTIVVRQFGDIDITDDERKGERSTPRGDENDGLTDITSKMLDLMGCRSAYGTVATISNDDESTVGSEEVAEGRNYYGTGNNDNNKKTTPSIRKRRQGKIRIPAVESSHRIAQTVDKAWARELFETRKETREAILEELHGVQSRAASETKETIRSGLLAMEREISSTVAAAAASSSSRAFRTLVKGHLVAIERLRSEYVVAPEFRLRFLRSEFFHAGRAARRYFKHLNYLRRYFGTHALERQLELSDLSSTQRRFLEQGKIQILLNRDRMGRRMLLVFGTTLTGVSILDRFMVEDLLVFGTMAEDDETQLHGATCIVFFHPPNGEEEEDDDETEKEVTATNRGAGEEPEQQQREQVCYGNRPKHSSELGIDGPGWDETEKKTFQKFFRFRLGARRLYSERMEATPLRWSSIHLCVPNNRVYRFLSAVMLGMIPLEYRFMTKIHFGSQLECTYELTRFGIPAEALGVSTMKSKSLQKVLKARASVESFRRDVCSQRGQAYYRTPSKLPREQRPLQQLDSRESDGSNETTTYEGTETSAAAPATVGAAERPTETNFDISTNDFCPGTDCPPSSYVIFGDRSTYKYPANIAFREYLREFLRTKIASEDGGNNNKSKTKTSLRLNVKILDQIIDETCAGTNSGGAFDGNDSLSPNRFRFAVYEKELGWYRYMLPFRNESDRIELRKRISQTLRDDRKKRTMTNSNNSNSNRANRGLASFTTAASTLSSPFRNTDDVDREVLYAKRFKTSHNQCWDLLGDDW